MVGAKSNQQPRFFSCAPQIVDQQDTRVPCAVAEHQRADVAVLGYKHAAMSERFLQQCRIAGIGRPFRGMHYIVARGAQRTHGRRCDIGVREEAHAYSAGTSAGSARSTTSAP